MAMNVSSAEEGEEQFNNTINTTPLVDVMLVLLIIFLITIPVVTQTIKLELPKERNLPTQTKPENIVIAVNRDGEVYWGLERMPRAFGERDPLGCVDRVRDWPWSGHRHRPRGARRTRFHRARRGGVPGQRRVARRTAWR